MIFQFEHTVPYFAVDENLKMKETYVFDLLLEVANRHGQFVNRGVKELIGSNMTWMMYKWRIKFVRRPSATEKISIRTWPSTFQKIKASREYELVDENGEVLVYGSSIWVLIDLEKGKPMMIPDDFRETFGLEKDAKAFFKNFDKFRYDVESSSVETFKVRRSDIDMNHHVNSVNYLEWMLETVEPSGKNLDEIEIYYVNQAKYGDIISSELAFIEESEEEDIYIHRIYVKGEEEVYTYGKSTWRK